MIYGVTNMATIRNSKVLTKIRICWQILAKLSNIKFHEYAFGGVELLKVDRWTHKNGEAERCIYVNIWLRMRQKKKPSKMEIKSRTTMFTADICHSYLTMTVRRQTNIKCYRHVHSGATLLGFKTSERQPKASAAIKDCLFYEGVNLLLATCWEGGGRGGGLSVN
jgi:hypothetical protein